MKILTEWLREYLPGIPVEDHKLAEDLTLRGIAVDGAFDLGPGKGLLLEMDITTNRVDAMNHYGIAREASAIYGLALPPLDASVPVSGSTSGSTSATKPYPVRIEAPDLCGRFTARVLRSVTIKPSTGLLARRFAALEQKLISNAVDATNYAWIAMGQPTHVFDLDKLEGGIVVRRARKGEKLRTLDGVERTLYPDDLVVADEKKALAIAGVMGGWDSMITPETKNVLVEAAWFDPASIRGTSRRHGLHTDASHRFERGADFNAPPVASALVSRMLLADGGEAEGELVDVAIPEAAARTANRSAVRLELSEVRRILGTTVDAEGITTSIVENVLTALGCSLVLHSEGVYDVTLPSWRLDLEREIDLIEEIARVYGYNRFANTLPVLDCTVVELPWARQQDAVRSTLLALGWNEALSSTFASATDAVAFAPQPSSTVAMGNPLNEEAGILRPSLVPGMLTMLGSNLNRNVEDVRLFEMGTVFSGTTDRVDERPALSIGATGLTAVEGPHQPPRPVDFYDVKGSIEELLSRFAMRSLYFDNFAVESHLMPKWLHPGRSARVVVEGSTIGYFGELHPAEAHSRKLKQKVFVGEIYLDRLYRQALRQPSARELSRFQAVRRDFSLIFPDTVLWSQVDGALRELRIEELVSVAAKEVFRDRKQEKPEYSLLLGTVFQSQERTLREEEVQGYSEQILKAMEQLGGRLRS
ncbi:MAG TPA: phenylalanine--tRNA ligase subunit beta [Acidisarcina sp.]|nr:phenylalanine--tRNA ligase subunit beta [Acidisarcina sp.]